MQRLFSTCSSRTLFQRSIFLLVARRATSRFHEQQDFASPISVTYINANPQGPISPPDPVPTLPPVSLRLFRYPHILWKVPLPTITASGCLHATLDKFLSHLAAFGFPRITRIEFTCKPSEKIGFAYGFTKILSGDIL